ncbi:TonB-dependent siderophore receptor [Herbaspirillum seropedicae]|uniref:TonB-dependent receptor n=1 Tax=Herbaspirillum seropedicae TaxID=964 RepID=UPI0031DF28A2
MFLMQSLIPFARVRRLPAALCLAFLALPAYAAERDGGNAGEPSGESSLPVVEVRDQRRSPDPRARRVGTATRSAADPMEVPQSIQSVSVEQVSVYGARTLAGALLGVPGISSISDTRFDAFRIRGFSSANDLLLDGMRDDPQYVRGLGNIERVEVLRGPASVLYGRGSGGGVINRISKQPGQELASQATLSLGSAGLLGAALDWNRPLAPHWALRINTGREHAGSFRDTVNGTRQYFAPALKWESGRDSWLLQAEYDEYERVPDRGIPGRAIATANGEPTAYALPSAGHEQFFGAAGRDVIRDIHMSLRSTLTRALSQDWTLRHALALMDLNSNFDNTFVTQAYQSAPLDLDRVQRTRYQQNLQQRSVQNNLELLGQLGAHDLLLGVEHSWQKREPRLWSVAAPAVSAVTPENTRNGDDPTTPFQMNYHKASNLGLYVQDQITLAAHWKMLAGLRWDRFEVDSRNRRNGVRSERTAHALSPRIGVVWEALPGQHAYLSWSKNFAPVGGDVIGITPDARGNFNDLKPQFSRQVEVGIKSEWLDRRLSTTLAWFQLELFNRNVADPVRPGFFEQSGLERNRGIELSVEGELAAPWFVRAGWAIQSAKIVQAEPKFVGKRASGVSGRGGSLFLSYAPTLGWFAELGLTVEGARYADRDNLLELPAYTRWDGKMGYRLDEAEFTLAVTNLANRRYYESATGLSQVRPGAPRALLLTAAYKF